MARDRDGWFASRFPQVLAASGVLVLLWAILEPIALFAITSPELPRLRYAIGYVTVVPACVGIVWGGRWLERSTIPGEYYGTIGVFVSVGGAGFLLFNLFLMLFFPTDSLATVSAWIRWALSLGMGVGLVVGVSYARGLTTSITAERQSMRAEHLQKQRDLVDHMNDILRHEVLNSAQVINGNAAVLCESDERIDPADERLERIRRQGAELTEVVQEVRALLNTVEEPRNVQPIDLARVIGSEADNVTSTHPAITVDADVPEDLTVEADELVGRVFGNLLRNAAEHNDALSLRISIEATRTDDAVVVTVSDDGDGIPEEKVATLFDRPTVGTHGLGLHIVSELVDSYGGTVELRETGATGTVFCVTLPRPNGYEQPGGTVPTSETTRAPK